MKPTQIEAILEMIVLYKNTIANLEYEKDWDDYRHAGWYLMDISDAEDKIAELENMLP